MQSVLPYEQSQQTRGTPFLPLWVVGCLHFCKMAETGNSLPKLRREKIKTFQQNLPIMNGGYGSRIFLVL